MPPHVMLAQTWSLQAKLKFNARIFIDDADAKFCTKLTCDATFRRVAPRRSVVDV